MNLIVVALRASKIGLKLLFQMLDDCRYCVGMLQSFQEQVSLTGAERVDGYSELIEIDLFHLKPPIITGVSYSLAQDQHLSRT